MTLNSTTYGELFYKHYNGSVMGASVEYGILYHNLVNILRGNPPRNRERLEELMDALDDICGFPTRDMVTEYEPVHGYAASEAPEGRFSSLHELFEYLGVVVEIDDSEFYKYKVVSK